GQCHSKARPDDSQSLHTTPTDHDGAPASAGNGGPGGGGGAAGAPVWGSNMPSTFVVCDEPGMMVGGPGIGAPGNNAGDGIAGTSPCPYSPGGPGGGPQPGPGGGTTSPIPVYADTVGCGSGASPGPAPPGASFGSV